MNRLYLEGFVVFTILLLWVRLKTRLITRREIRQKYITNICLYHLCIHFLLYFPFFLMGKVLMNQRHTVNLAVWLRYFIKETVSHSIINYLLVIYIYLFLFCLPLWFTCSITLTTHEYTLELKYHNMAIYLFLSNNMLTGNQHLILEWE